MKVYISLGETRIIVNSIYEDIGLAVETICTTRGYIKFKDVRMGTRQAEGWTWEDRKEIFVNSSQIKYIEEL